MVADMNIEKFVLLEDSFLNLFSVIPYDLNI